MSVSIRPTTKSEAEELCRIQKEAFRPLYEKYQDAGNPYLRGPEDILCRLNKNNRYFTILYEGTMVGGIFYRCRGKRSPGEELGDHEYYLARIYIHPAFQGRGIAGKAILLCEQEFPDASAYYVDFPEDLEKNRACYTGAGFFDTGERVRMDGTPVLAVYKRTVEESSNGGAVRFPMIHEVDPEELEQCLDVIHESFRTVAEEFGITKENCPRHTSFLPLSFLETHRNWGWHMLGLYAGKALIGYMSLSKEGDGTYELHNLAVLPSYRHCGFGTHLLEHAKNTVRAMGGSRICIGIIEEHTVLKKWYEKHGFTHVGTKKYDHLPFTSGYMEWRARDRFILTNRCPQG